MLKITSGIYKGKQLISPEKNTTRATKSIVKASLFNTLQFDLPGANFVEVFGGSGSVGLEALSRGAKKSFFIERDKKAYGILIKNTKLIDAQNRKCFLGDSFHTFEKLLSHINSDTYFYFDPPFEFRDNMNDIYEKTVALIQKCPKEYTKMIIVEHNSSVKFEDITGLELLKSKKFGKTTLTYYKID
ncbi:MAG: 16S rRNA (Guanine(966)-N(2))-methyltransferase RsmD [uncultured Campylobacterales bacterium]|uniref:16S rRNA (Guanine(966)-N(2))-methyltransferase RsmD n=1 Tax=uncultured Campylobacterales bacterium TaxID=352960 RepID=A0A6S6S6E8_9BACT|nr:MAG: 16S rRNA (Guanine(966)-N(2))-methyltransferase RsmD [uncultured Campylobacterales bacterium]